ncbi:hypothetical protein O9K51_06965 [Purpureocillium lavendulum]|uniref:Uncharacterized protein n=1 Tax=Purpureocillium lavendulum TaxID=1247861 RepID=A0AB34FQH9_9HYPO|nr:hypothetical protein O9K51_06965 [Purpureocillium lavendulum]
MPGRIDLALELIQGPKKGLRGGIDLASEAVETGLQSQSRIANPVRASPRSSTTVTIRDSTRRTSADKSTGMLWGCPLRNAHHGLHQCTKYPTLTLEEKFQLLVVDRGSMPPLASPEPWWQIIQQHHHWHQFLTTTNDHHLINDFEMDIQDDTDVQDEEVPRESVERGIAQEAGPTDLRSKNAERWT